MSVPSESSTGAHTCATTSSALAAQHNDGRYNLTAVAMFKAETSGSLRAWVHHYLFEGVDHFVLIDNNNATGTHDESCELRPFIDAGIVTLVKDAEPHAQHQVIARHLHPFVTHARTTWVLNVDIDELVYARNNRTIWSFLEMQPSRVQCVYLPWKTFGAAGIARPAGEVAMHALYRWPSSLEDEGGMKWVARAEALVGRSFHQHSLDLRRYGRCAAILPDATCFDERRAHGTINGSDESFTLHLNHYRTHSSREAYATSKLIRGDVLDATQDHAWDWNRYRNSNAQATLLDGELRSKRFERVQRDQEILDAALCAKRHAGGSPPRDWCPRDA